MDSGKPESVASTNWLNSTVKLVVSHAKRRPDSSSETSLRLEIVYNFWRNKTCCLSGRRAMSAQQAMWTWGITTFLTLVTFGFLIWQLWLTRKNMENLYEQSRRIQTIDVFSNWVSAMNPIENSLYRIVAHLNENQCQDLYKLKEFDITDLESGLKPYLCNMNRPGFGRDFCLSL